MLIRRYSLLSFQKSSDERRESVSGGNPLEELKALLSQTASEISVFIQDIAKELKQIYTVEAIVEKKEICQFIVKIKKVHFSFRLFLVSVIRNHF